MRRSLFVGGALLSALGGPPGCGGALAPPGGVEPATIPVEACRAYAETPGPLGVCLANAAGDPALGLDADEVCALAGPFAADCRLAWVQARLPSLPLDALLAACGGAPDCALVALDGRPLPLTEQLPRCRDAAGPYALDCVRHALDRWARARGASAADLAGLDPAWGEAPWGEEIGRYLAAVVVCAPAAPGAASRSTCGPPALAACEAASAEVRADPGICDRLGLGAAPAPQAAPR